MNRYLLIDRFGVQYPIGGDGGNLIIDEEGQTFLSQLREERYPLNTPIPEHDSFWGLYIDDDSDESRDAILHHMTLIPLQCVGDKGSPEVVLNVGQMFPPEVLDEIRAKANEENLTLGQFLDRAIRRSLE